MQGTCTTHTTLNKLCENAPEESDTVMEEDIQTVNMVILAVGKLCDSGTKMLRVVAISAIKIYMPSYLCNFLCGRNFSQ